MRPSSSDSFKSLRALCASCLVLNSTTLKKYITQQQKHAPTRHIIINQTRPIHPVESRESAPVNDSVCPSAIDTRLNPKQAKPIHAKRNNILKISRTQFHETVPLRPRKYPHGPHLQPASYDLSNTSTKFRRSSLTQTVSVHRCPFGFFGRRSSQSHRVGP